MFASIEASLYPIVVTINNYLSSYILIFLLTAIGLWYTVKTRFVQIRYLGAGLKQVFGDISLKGKHQKNGMSSFQALATAIAAQVGTIFGELPGAVFVAACLFSSHFPPSSNGIFLVTLM